MIIEKYSSDWIKNFTDIKREIEQGLNGLEYQIEHVGSTSVPNLDSKPIIDIDIIINNRSEFKTIKIGLIKIGYYHKGNQGNFLRKNEWARIEYQEMKYEMARRANQNKKIYAELKELNINGFIDKIIEKEKTTT